jgi:hypothetical protein
MRSITETEEERNSVEITINAKGEIASVVKLYFEGYEQEVIEKAVDLNLHARDHYFTAKLFPQKEEVK